MATDTVTVTREQLVAALDSAMPNNRAYGPIAERLFDACVAQVEAPAAAAPKPAKKPRARKTKAA